MSSWIIEQDQRSTVLFRFRLIKKGNQRAASGNFRLKKLFWFRKSGKREDLVGSYWHYIDVWNYCVWIKVCGLKSMERGSCSIQIFWVSEESCKNCQTPVINLECLNGSFCLKVTKILFKHISLSVYFLGACKGHVWTKVWTMFGQALKTR